MIKHMIINVSQVMHCISSNQKANKFNQEDKREQKTANLSLEAYDLYIFLPLWQQVTKKPRKCIALNRLSGLVFRWWCPDNSKDEGFS